VQQRLERWGERGQGSAPLAWIRPDPRPRLTPVWRSSLGLVLLGGGLCAWFFKELAEDPIWALLLGLLSVATGMLRFVYIAMKVLGDERCLSLFKEGLIARERRAERVMIAWSELAAIELLEESGAGGGPELRLSIHTRGAEGELEERCQLELTDLPISPEALKRLLLECARRDALGVALKLEAQLEELGLEVGLPSARG